ncbi:MAG: valine--tRNA ligase [Planctomycetota bacterium]|jgi:valyl-tRNA synthetase
MAEQLSKVYEPKAIEQQTNQIWIVGGHFHAKTPPEISKAAKSYAIMIPPPNVTAPLHLGHALNNTLQDILIRFHRMQNYNTLWMPGTDHAGIATQTVVEKQLLSEQGKRRTDFEREEFIAHVQDWKDEYEARIIEQLKAMGCSCDWQRTRFTMDKVCAKAVRAAFFKLFADGLIYRGKRLVNWDPATQTVLADDEVEHETVRGHFWYLRYPLAEPVQIETEQIEYVTVATTRPETMLGDTAVAMNPADRRAKELVGKKVRLPIVGRLIPIVADEHVVLPDPESEDEKARFSTGFLKVTPAHDPDDWEIGLRQNLLVVNVMAPDGSISDKYGWEDATTPEAQSLLGMDRFEAREAVVEWFRQEKLLEDVREYVHEVGHSYRSHVPIEPYLSDQWYIAVKKPIEHLAEKFGDGLIENTDVPVNSLAGLALKPLLDGRLHFTPERYAKTYQSWLENLRDWPISRQLWWGHRIPIWTIQFNPAYWANILEQGETKHKEEIKQEFSELLNLCGIGDNIACRQSDEDRYRLHICGVSLKADRMLDFLCRLISNKKRELDPNLPKNTLIRFQTEHQMEIKEFQNEFGEKAYSKIDSLHRSIINSCERDEDVLDTWFSSALWPFSTLGWPDDTPALKTFYPGDVLCTAREIITLWVSRMVMMGQYCAGNIPFSDVYIHAMIQDGEGRKMSKSLGNGIDPLVAIDSHGADAMRFTLASMTTDTQDIRMPVETMTLPDGRKANTSPKFDIGRNFCNKLWNASRFAMMNLEGFNPEEFDKTKMAITDKWILSRLVQTITDVTKSLERFKYSEPLSQLYRFFWNDFCDWYLEWLKPRMNDAEQKPIAQNILAFVLDRTLRLLHPFVPFITEGIFQKLNEIAPVRSLTDLVEAKETEALVSAEWPKKNDSLMDQAVEKQIAIIQAVIRAIRDIRSNRNIPPKELKVVSIKSQQENVDILNRNTELIQQLAGVADFNAGIAIVKPANAAVAIADAMEVYVHDAVDTKAERKKLEKQKEKIEKAKKAVEAKLGNESFIIKAKPQVVAQAREKLAELTEQLKTIEEHLSQLDE